jgi:hypothetical protein
MTAPQRQRLFDLLMEGVPSEKELGAGVYREMVELTTADLDRIEPVIDEFISAAARKAA